MTTKVDICNSALSKIGVDPIDNFDEDSQAARECKQIYDLRRRKLLRSHFWNFAVGRVELTADVATPAFGFSTQFSLPSDYIRMIELNDREKCYKIEKGKLLVSSDTAKLRYVQDIEDVDAFDDTFVEALAYDIAAELAFTLTQSASLAQAMYDKFLLELKDTRSFDAQDEGDIPYTPVNDWITARLGGDRDFGRKRITP